MMSPIESTGRSVAFLMAVLCVPVATALTGQSFVKITADPLTTQPGGSHGANWGDFNNDGWLDLIVPRHGFLGNLLGRNTGTGDFLLVTNDVAATDLANSYSCLWGDFNNDGWLDLFVGAFGTNLFYLNQRDGTFARVLQGNTFLTDGQGSCAAAALADYNLDGNLDIFVCYLGDHTNLLYRGDGAGGFIRVTPSAVNEMAESNACTWGDYDDDGFPDLFVANGHSTPGANFLYHNGGDGTFQKVTLGDIVTDVGTAFGAAWGDYDNDGYLDLFVARNGQNNALYHNLGNGTFTKITSGAIVNDVAGFYNCAWGDYDNDGWLDLIVLNFNGQGNYLYHNIGDGTFVRVTNSVVTAGAGHSAGCAWGDSDNDGALDLYVANHGGSNFLYHNEGSTNSWLTVRCVGTMSNRSAIGAQVRVHATIAGTSRWQLRPITSGDGASGGSLEAHFGLGDAEMAEAVVVEWPSGIRQELRDVRARRILTVIEPVRLQVNIGPTPGALQLSFPGRLGLRYGVDRSADLVSWSTVGVFTNATGPLRFEDTLSTNIPAALYRAWVE